MLPFRKYTVKAPIHVVAPGDPAVHWHLYSDRAVQDHQQGKDLIEAATGMPGATVFEVRALGPNEVAAVNIMRAPLSVSASADLQAARATLGPGDALRVDEFSGRTRSELSASSLEELLLYARAGMVRIVRGQPEGWDFRPEPFGALQLWSAEAVMGFGVEVASWLGSVVRQLTHPIDEEKKSVSG